MKALYEITSAETGTVLIRKRKIADRKSVV